LQDNEKSPQADTFATFVLGGAAPTDRRSSSLIKVQRSSPVIADLQVFREGYFSQ
jgi:hypothetical protein